MFRDDLLFCKETRNLVSMEELKNANGSVFYVVEHVCI